MYGPPNGPKPLGELLETRMLTPQLDVGKLGRFDLTPYKVRPMNKQYVKNQGIQSPMDLVPHELTLNNFYIYGTASMLDPHLLYLHATKSTKLTK